MRKTSRSRGTPPVDCGEPVRLQKLLALAGLGSRRQIEGLIVAGRITGNGRLATLGDKAGYADRICFDGRKVKLKPGAARTRVLIYNKPRGEVTTRRDEKSRPTVFQNLPKIQDSRWIVVGRLDINTSGLLLFTNNGELANRLMHPSGRVERRYAVRVLGEVNARTLDRLRTGVKLEDGIAKFESIHYQGGEGANHWYHVTLCEGRNREVRRLWESQDLKVSRLIRIAYGPISLPKSLPGGKHCELSTKDVRALECAVEQQ